MPRQADAQSHDGFTLLETAIALSVVAACMVAVGSLLHVSLTATGDARDETITTMLGLQKLEMLRVSAGAASPSTVSPAGSIDVSMAGYFDIIDASGHPLAAAAVQHSPVYLRRWMTRTMSQSNGQTMVFFVRVVRVRAADGLEPQLRTEARLSATRFVR